jgi:citrate synthase
MSLVLPALALGDPGRFLLSERSDLTRARRLIRATIEQLALARPRALRQVQRASSVAQALLLALGGRADEAAVAAVDRALILVLDHELNASTFAARVAASTGADLYACLGAALATLSGPRHGGATDRVEALLAEVASPRRASSAVVARRRRGEAIPGFGHRRYPAGDPRAVPLLQYAERSSERVEVRTLRAVRRAMQRAGQPPPTIDFALVSLAQALGLAKGSAAILFFVGRTAGWVAHVLEQRRQGGLLRPRAAYAGRTASEGARAGRAPGD